MIYLDYSATTKVNDKVLEEFLLDCKKNHQELESLILEEKNKIKKLLNTNLEVEYTSGATESNNIVIKCIANKYKEKGKRIITTKLEHSSILEPLEFLEKQGFIIDYVNLNEGVVDLNHLESLISKDTILITIASVGSEVGILQPVERIGEIAKENKILFHSDMTQSIGKLDISIKNIDLISFSAHKFYGLKGIGVLLKNKDIYLDPLYPKKETFYYPLIKSVATALSLATDNLKEKNLYVESLNKEITNFLGKYSDVRINSNEKAIPHILNISIINSKPETFQHRLEQYDVFVSTKSACHDDNDISLSVYAVTKNEKAAKTSLRISISSKTTKEEIKSFLRIFDICMKETI